MQPNFVSAANTTISENQKIWLDFWKNFLLFCWQDKTLYYKLIHIRYFRFKTNFGKTPRPLLFSKALSQTDNTKQAMQNKNFNLS